jgi:hypothetical protein
VGGFSNQSTTVEFPREVLRFAVGLTGYEVRYGRDNERRFGRLTVLLAAEMDGPNRVRVASTLGVRDWSGEFDDPYIGSAQWVLFADLVDPTPPGPGAARSDLQILGVEITQAIQHFRSHRHLHVPNLFPDNSIRMVANKPTAARVYVDYDSSSGLPPIATLTAEMDVSSPGGNATLVPVEPIIPRRDARIDRGNGSHTLNFIIPEDLCQGVVSLRARVFSETDLDQFSSWFEQEIRFEEMPELRIMAIAIDYTGPDILPGAPPDALRVPVQADFDTVLAFVEKLYPIPGVVITSFNTMPYSEEMFSDINEGCEKFGDLKDFVAEMRGDSNDLVYGLINTGVNTGSVGGCGGGGAGVGKVGSGPTAAHELGHAVGRQHAPCDNVTRCHSPADQDEEYPDYSGYDSDSIGEYGFDVDAAEVRDPGTFHDIMGYSGIKWISPYTYKALMSRIPMEGFGASSSGAAAAALVSQDDAARRAEGGEWEPRATPHLYLRIDVARNREVRFQHAFHFDSPVRDHDEILTPFTVELQDEAGNVLRSACLYTSSNCCGCKGHGCRWPIRVRQAIAYHPRSASLVLYEEDGEIYRRDIPRPPEVHVECTGDSDPNEEAILLHWEVTVPEGTDASDLWFLVQWCDRTDTWRGCAPRIQARQLRVPKRLFGQQQEVALRVLASSGIATGVGEWQGRIISSPSQDGGDGALRVQLEGVPAKGTETITLPPMVRAIAVLPGGRTLSRPDIRWYDGRGSELGRGRSFDLRKLPRGQTLLRVAVFDTGQGSARAQWLVERTASAKFRLLRGDTGKAANRNGPC